MKRAAMMLACWMAATGSAVAAQKAAKPTPDADYCSRRDADPEKCMTQDGPPNRNIIRKPPPDSKSKVESRKSKVSKPGTLEK